MWIDYTPTVAGDCLLSIELAMGISVVLRVRLATCLTPTVCVRVQTTVAALRFKMLRFVSPWRRDPLLLAVVLRRLVVCVLPGIHAQCELHMPLSLPQVPSTTTPGDETHATIHGKGLKLALGAYRPPHRSFGWATTLVPALDEHGNRCDCGGARFVVQVTSAVQFPGTHDDSLTFVGPSSGQLMNHPGGVTETRATVHDRGDGTYVATFTPQEPGVHYVAIMLGRRHVKGSPFTLRVALPDAAAVSPTHSVVEGGGATGCVARKDASFSIKVWRWMWRSQHACSA